MKAVGIFLLLLYSNHGLAQTNKPKDILIGLHFFYNDFKTAELIQQSSIGKVVQQKTWSKPLVMQSGFGLSALKYYNQKIAFYAAANASRMDYPNAAYQYQNKDKFLLDISVGTQISMFPKKTFINPYISGGITINSWGGKGGYLLPVGMGIQINLFKESFINANFQKQFAITKNATTHFYYNLGIATTVFSKTKLTVQKDKAHIIIKPPITIEDKDTDGDGVLDKLDKCPDIVGAFTNAGCPIIKDSDGDGIADAIDKCPDSAGLIANNGCPEKQVAIKILPPPERMPDADIRFENNSYTVSNSSSATLAAIANYLLKNTTVVILIEGHTDNVGSITNNLLLSRKRALQVQQFLVQKGIDENRLFMVAWGEEKPRTNNTTNEGRAINRRVEIIER
jgi:OmpA-OmpF porin, OOP family